MSEKRIKCATCKRWLLKEEEEGKTCAYCEESYSGLADAIEADSKGESNE